MVSVRRLSHSLFAVVALLAVAVGPAQAQSYPDKPIRFLVGFSPGSSIDTVARILGDHVRNKLGQSVVVENRTGANGMLAATELAKSAPDGYTVLISNSSTITVNPLLYKDMQYDVERDLKPVSLVVSVPFILTVNPDKAKADSVETLADFLKLAKNRPGKLAYGSAGRGNLTQIAFELLNQQAGVQMVHVPYRGSAPAQVALLAGEVDAAMDNPSATPIIKAGRLKALAVSSARRWHDLPDVPTIAEVGYPGYDISFWVGVFMPAKTPDAVAAKLYEAIKAAADDPEVRGRLSKQGNVELLDPKQFHARIRKETAQYAEIIKRANISLD